MLLNYKGTLDSVFTLAHELGHSMHTWLANQSQGFRYADYAILVAEVASTTNEMLLTSHLLDHATDPRFRRYLLNHLCDGFKGTVYRQVQFAEFERLLFDMAEKGEPLTHEGLSDRYYEINSRYYGSEVEADRRIALSGCASRTSTTISTCTSTPPASRPPSPSPRGYSRATRQRSSGTSGSSRPGRASILSTRCATRASDLAKPDAVVAGLARFDRTVAGLQSELGLS